MTASDRQRAKPVREAERRRRFKKHLRRPWLVFRRRFRREIYEEAAISATGLDDFGDEYYGSGLDRLIESLRGAGLTFIGRMMTQRSIVLALKQRLLIEDLRKRDRHFFEGKIIPPIIVTGLPRTGTTLLHRLLAVDPNSRAPTLEEMIAPVPPPSALTARLDRIRLGAELFTLRAYTRNLDAMHVSRATSPEECMFAMSVSFRTMLFWTLSSCYSYMEWYTGASRTKKYGDYRDILRVLQSRAQDRRLVLKAPEHLGSVAELMAAVPEALLVVCHRRPSEAVTSFNSLIHALHQTVTAEPDPMRIARTHLLYFEGETRRYVEARRALAQRILEVDYEELTNDPPSIVRRIYDRAGLALAPDLDRRFRTFIAANPKDKLGRHRYQASDYGQTEAMIDERLAHYRMAL